MTDQTKPSTIDTSKIIQIQGDTELYPQKPLPTNFYEQHVVDVARQLIGKILVFNQHHGIITETEAYRGSDDLASHAARGITPRSQIMFGPAGYSYIYLIYGIHHCLNIVAEEKGQPAAVLIRGLQLPHAHLNGPGKITQHLGITKAHNGIDIVNNPSFYVSEGFLSVNYETTRRIGIKKDTSKLWRFNMTGKSEDERIYFP